MAHEQKPDFVFRRNGRVHLNRRGRQFSRLLAAEVFASAVVTLDTPRSEVVWRVLATHSIRQFPLQFPSRAPPCAIRFQLDLQAVKLMDSLKCTLSCNEDTSSVSSAVYVQYTLSNKNPPAWNFLSPAPEVTCGTVAIIIRVILLSPYLRIRAVSLSSIHYSQSHRVYINEV